jgi:hexosaminidase
MITKQSSTILKILFLCLSLKNIANAQSIIPYPNKMELQTGSFNLSTSTKIYYDKNCKNEAVILQQLLSDEHHIKLQVTEKKLGWKGKEVQKLPAGSIYLIASTLAADSMTSEEYRLKVDQKNIIASGGTSAGVFYAIQSLRQLLTQQGDKLNVPCLTIDDKPRFAWRAFMLDEGRYFKGAKVVKDLLDEMAMLKMNVFHWHLTDDQGWRIEIKKYPKLTEIGSKRKMSEIDYWLSNKFDSIEHAGYYTQEQIKDIIQYAAARHITIVPELEMPGHASAAIASYPWLGSADTTIEVVTRFGIQLNVYNVANPRVNQFIRDVLDEVMALFPSQVVHIGGDEVKYDQWKKSNEVNEYMQKNNINSYADLQISFTNAISNYLEQKNHRMMGWNDILGGLHQNNDSVDASTKQKLSPNVIVHFWTGDPKIIDRAVERGYDVVNSFWEYTYVDYDYNTTSLQKAYNFDPVPTSLPEHLRSKILGMGCQMWGEWIPTVQRMNYHIFPRIAAYAETGWTESSNKDFGRFKNGLSNYLKPHWSKEGITILPTQE